MRSKSRELKDKIAAYIEDVACRGGNCPAYRDIGRAVGADASTVCRYVAEMERDGELVDGEFGYMTRSMAGRAETASVAVLGSVPCGPLAEATECIEGYAELPLSLLGRGSKFFLLRANGDSMTGAGIDDGDYVLIRRQFEAEEGDIVVALVENEVTLKRYYVDRAAGKVRLHPENERYPDIYADTCTIQGKAIKVLKELG